MSAPTTSGARRLILASASPRRRELLSSLGVSFEVVVADVVEHEERSMDPRLMVARNSALKAEWVAQRHPKALVLGADTTVFVDGHALNKPGDLGEARSMLRSLSGRTHTVFTGVAVRCWQTGLVRDEGAISEVTFKELDEATISAYLERVHVLDKAGSYGIQEHPGLIIAGYRGSLSNIVGLPLEITKQILTDCGLLDINSQLPIE